VPALVVVVVVVIVLLLAIVIVVLLLVRNLVIVFITRMLVLSLRGYPQICLEDASRVWNRADD